MSIGQYDYEGLCEEYLKQSRKTGKTAQKRMWFINNKLYSYNSLLAELDLKNKVILVDKYIASYSVTSHKHANILYTSARKSEKFIIYIVNLNINPINNLIEDLEELYKLLLKYKRARQNKLYIKDHLIQKYNKVQSYIEYVHIDKRTKPYKQFKQFFNILFEAKLL